jgi:translocation and assembly module TamB
MNPILRWLIISLFVLWLLVVAILAVGYGLLSTNSGSRWLLEKVDSSVSQLELSWQTAEGSLMQGLDFQDLRVFAQGTTVEADYFALQWDLFDLLKTEMTLNDLRVRNLVVVLPEAEEPTAEPSPWPSVSLPIAFVMNTARVEGIRVNQPGGEEGLRIDLLEFSGVLRSSNLRIDQFLIEQGDYGAELAGRITLAPPYSLSAGIQWHGGATIDGDDLVLEGRGEVSGDLARIALEHHLLEPLSLETVGTLETGFDASRMGLQPNQFTTQLENSWDINNFALPTLAYHLTSSGQLDVEGGLQNSQIDARFRFSVPELGQLPRQQVSLGAQIQGNTANLQTFEVNTGFGQLNGHGDVQWANVPSWNFTLQLSGIDPGHFVTELPGSIEATLVSSGQWQNDALDTALQIEHLEGQLRGFPLSGEGNLAYRDNRIVVDVLQVRAGDNRLRLDGFWGTGLELAWNLAAPQLNQLYPGLDGTLSIEGTATGQPSSPEVSARVSADAVQYQDISAGSIRGSIRGGARSSQMLDLSVTDLALGEQQFDLTLGMSGNLSQHQYDLQLTPTTLGQEMNARLSGSAVVEDERWTSDIGVLDLDLGFAGQWSLANPDQTGVSIARNGVALSSFCLQSGAATLCPAPASFENGEVNLAVELGQIPIDLFNEFMPQDVRITGGVSGNLELSGPLDELQGNVELGAPEIILTISQLQQTEFHRLEANQLSGTYENSQISLNLDSQLAGNGLIDGQARLDLRSEETPLEARLEARFSELTWLDPFLPQLSELDGDTRIDIDVSGTLQNPLVSGDMHMASLTAFVPEAGILLEQGRLDLENRGAGNWDLSASVQSGGGAIDLEGEVLLNSPGDWNIGLDITGDQFNAYAMDSTQVYVSPALDLRLSPQRIDVSGDIHLPRADFVIRELPASTVKVSRDEVVISEQPDADSQQQGGPDFSADVNLMLGDEVMFEGFNIQGRLAGQLRLREAPDAPRRVEGSIEIIDGTYSAYGQELTIDPGQLVFNGSAENPSLNVRAYRTVEGNLVGVHLGGTVETLSSTLYSAPALPQTEILSLLVTGKSLSNTTSSEGNQLVSALTSLGIAQSALITESLQNTLNLDVLEISASEDIEDSSLTIGKYLSPSLFISYAQDILTPNSSVSLDYFLTDRIKINAKSGATQSMDIYYRFERCPDC